MVRGPAFHCFLPNFPPFWCVAQAVQVIIAFLRNFAPVMAPGPSSERALCRRSSYHLPFCFSCPPLWCAARAGRPAYHCLSAQFSPVMALGPSSERALLRRPSYHLPFVSFAHLYGTRPERASFSLPFCAIFPRYGARPEWASLSLLVCAIFPRYGARPVRGAGVP